MFPAHPDRKPIVTSALLLVLTLCPGAHKVAGQPSLPAQQHTERAAEYAQRGELKNAESELRQALELSPNDPALLTSLGGILGMEGDL